MIISVSFSLFLSFCASAVFLLYPCALVLLFFSFFFFFLPLFLSLSLPSLTLQLFLYIVNFLFLVNYIKEREKSALTFKLHECLCEIACDPLFVAVVSCRLFFFFVSSLCSSPIVSRFTHKSNLETTPVYWISQAWGDLASTCPSYYCGCCSCCVTLQLLYPMMDSTMMPTAAPEITAW